MKSDINQTSVKATKLDRRMAGRIRAATAATCVALAVNFLLPIPPLATAVEVLPHSLPFQLSMQRSSSQTLDLAATESRDTDTRQRDPVFIIIGGQMSSPAGDSDEPVAASAGWLGDIRMFPMGDCVASTTTEALRQWDEFGNLRGASPPTGEYVVVFDAGKGLEFGLVLVDADNGLVIMVQIKY